MADEDTWLKMNRGYIADLDSLQMTPGRKVQSFPPTEVTPVSICLFLFLNLISLERRLSRQLILSLNLLGYFTLAT